MDPTRAAVAIGVAFAFVACSQAPDARRARQPAVAAITQLTPPPGVKWRPLSDRSFPPTAQRLARGAYLSEGLLQCFVCHSERDWAAPGAPPVAGRKGAGVVWRDDGKKRLVAPNLTSDKDSGIGNWTDDMLARAIREGIGHDGRVLHPAMWYGSFARLSDEDLASVVVYLRTLPPVRNPLPKTLLTAEEQKRYADKPRPITAPMPAPDQSTPLARGRYLAGLADCSGCHTSWYGTRMPGIYGGGNLVERGTRSAFSTNITADRTGMPYDADGFIQVMRTGRGGTLNPIMPWIVFRNLDDADLRAIHVFLHSLHPVRHLISNFAPPTQCAVCGQKHGLGDKNHIEPPQRAAVDPGLFDALVGRYRNDEYGWTMTVTRSGKRLLVQDNDLPPAELIPLSATRYVFDGGVAPLRFDLDASGKAMRLVSEEGDELVLQRVRP